MRCPAWTTYIDAREFCFAPGNPGHVFATPTVTSWIPCDPLGSPPIYENIAPVTVESSTVPTRIEPRYAGYCPGTPAGTPVHNNFDSGQPSAMVIEFSTDIPGAVVWSVEHDGAGDVAPHFDVGLGRLSVPYLVTGTFEFLDCNNDTMQSNLYQLSAFDGEVRVYATVGGLTYGPTTLIFSGTTLTEASFT